MNFPKISNQLDSKDNKNGKKQVKGVRFEFKFGPKDILLYAVVGLLVILTITSFIGNAPQVEKKPISQILADAKAGKVSGINLSENTLTVTYKDGKKVESLKDANQDLNRTLFSKDELGMDPKDITLTNKDDVTKNFWINFLLQFGPIVLFFGLLIIRLCNYILFPIYPQYSHFFYITKKKHNVSTGR
jgi:ATP-dependent Zn protease